MVDDLVSKSSQSWSRYMTLKGLTEHIGTDKSYFHLYIAKEDLDNAADYLENTYMDANDTRAIVVSVQINDTHALWCSKVLEGESFMALIKSTMKETEHH